MRALTLAVLFGSISLAGCIGQLSITGSDGEDGDDGVGGSSAIGGSGGAGTQVTGSGAAGPAGPGGAATSAGGAATTGAGAGTSAGGSTTTGGGDPCAGGPLAAPIAGCTPTPVPNSGDPYQDCVDRINQFRAECQCLPPLGRWSSGESCADQHAEFDSTNGPHAGFQQQICGGGFSANGFAQNECPGWGSTGQILSGCLQMMWDEGPGEPFSEHGHYINMSSSQYAEVACGFYTTPGGSVWSVQNFR